MRINMIGLKALPPQYSGFETAADEISRRLVELGHQVVFYNRKGLSTHRGDDYHGVRLVTLPTIARSYIPSSRPYTFCFTQWMSCTISSLAQRCSRFFPASLA